MFVTYFTDKLSGSLVAAFKPTGTKHSAMVTMLFYNIQKRTQNFRVFRKSVNIQEPKLSPPPPVRASTTWVLLTLKKLKSRRRSRIRIKCKITRKSVN
jgi:hypothetical protein